MTSLDSLYCPIRKAWIAALPEEHVRQRILKQMIEEEGFPASLIVVEKSVRQLTHLSPTEQKDVPDRRIDIICFAKKEKVEGELCPLLTIECKSITLTPRVMNQVLGYNHFVKSPFIAVANHNEIRTGWFDPQKQTYVFLDYLPSYKALCAKEAIS